MKAIRYILFLIISLAALLFACAEDPKMPDNLIGADKPDVVFLDNLLEKHATSVVVHGKVEKINGAPITEKGFIWYKEGDAGNLKYEKVTQDNEDGSFFSTITGLQDSTKYMISAYARNVQGEGISAYSSVTTISGIPEVKVIEEPVLVRANRAIIKGEITYPGEGTITDKGVSYRKESETTYEKGEVISEDGNTFEAEISSLEKETEYFVKVYVTNSFGTTESEEIKIKTTNGKPVIKDFKLIELAEEYATFTATITDNGDSPLIRRGFIYSETKEGLEEEDAKTVLVEGEDETFTAKLDQLKPQQQYFVAAFAWNRDYGITVSADTSFVLPTVYPTVETTKISSPQSGSLQIEGKVVDNGLNASLSTSGVIYSTTPEPTLENGTVIPSGHKDINVIVPGFKGNTLYYVRVYATNSNDYTSYGTVERFQTPDIFSLEAIYQGPALLDDGSAAYFSHRNQMGYLVGGNTGVNPSANFSEFNLQTQSWRNLNPLPEGLSWVSAIHTGDVPMVFGGLGQDSKPRNKLYFYSDDAWKEYNQGNLPPSPRYAAASCYASISLYVIGGITYGSNGTPQITNEVWSYATLRGLWVNNANIPEPQYRGLAFTVNAKVYAGLGLTSLNENTRSKHFFVYDEATDQWTELPSMPGGNALAGTVVNNEMIYIADDQGYLHVYNVKNSSWRTISQRLPVESRTINCMYGFPNNGKVYIGLGSNKNRLISYDPGWDN